jgi:hypothetical protein
MSEQQHVRADGTVTFLPHRLNRHPVVVRGLTADELWICCGLSGAAGLLVGAPLSWVFRTIAMAPTFVVLGVAAGRLHRRRHPAPPQARAPRHLAVPATAMAHRHAPSADGGLGGRPCADLALRLLVHPQEQCTMSRFKNEIAHLQAHIKTLAPGRRRAGRRRPGHGRRLVERAARPDHPRPARPALGQHPQVVGGAARIGLCVHVLRVPDPQPLADQWRRGLPRNLHTLSPYLTPSCQAFLRADYDYRRSTGELRQRVRGIYEIPGRGYGDDPTARVRTVSDRDWVVTLDISADEYYGAEQVKRALVRYPMKVTRVDVDPERNPFGLALDCYDGAPQRIAPEPTRPAPAACLRKRLKEETPHEASCTRAAGAAGRGRVHPSPRRWRSCAGSACRWRCR